ncbi:HPr family phosphocarrier protein, partial [Vibrio parahaemolyticus]|nr:HPr family phosphocarrier protein [Vibrio parahaemolyticus]
EQERTFDWVVQNPHGLHARPAAAIVGALAPFDCQLWLKKGEHRVNAKSLNSIAKLGVRSQETITLCALGPQSSEAIKAFEALASEHFGEKEAVEQGIVEPEESSDTLLDGMASSQIEGAVVGIRVNDGIATAPVVFFTHEMPAVPERDFQSEQDEIERVKRAIGVVVQHLQEQAKQPKGEIFAAHSMMLSDPELWASVESRIQTGMIAEQAWVESLQTLAKEFRQAESQYMREREADVHDIARQVMVEMTGVTPNAIDIQEPSILLARDLMPSDVAGLD